jgi:hypothetical protein
MVGRQVIVYGVIVLMSMSVSVSMPVSILVSMSVLVSTPVPVSIFSMDMDIDVRPRHGHRRVTWTRTCIMDMDMQHGHGHGHSGQLPGFTKSCNMTSKINRRRVTLTRQSQLILLKPLKIFLRSSCDGVPLKFKNKKGSGPVYQGRIFGPNLDPSKNSLDYTFKRSQKWVQLNSPRLTLKLFLFKGPSFN